MTKIEAIDKALQMIWEWQDEHDYCVQLSKSYPEVKKEYDETAQAVIVLEEIKTFLETG
jgi:hypothetical protein